jgi:hypothetical protein
MAAEEFYRESEDSEFKRENIIKKTALYEVYLGRAIDSSVLTGSNPTLLVSVTEDPTLLGVMMMSVIVSCRAILPSPLLLATLLEEMVSNPPSATLRVYEARTRLNI